MRGQGSGNQENAAFLADAVCLISMSCHFRFCTWGDTYTERGTRSHCGNNDFCPEIFSPPSFISEKEGSYMSMAIRPSNFCKGLHSWRRVKEEGVEHIRSCKVKRPGAPNTLAPREPKHPRVDLDTRSVQMPFSSSFHIFFGTVSVGTGLSLV